MSARLKPLATGILVASMIATAAWRLVNPPLSPREESWLASGYRQVATGRYGYAHVRFRKVLSINHANDDARTMLEVLDIYGYLLRKQPRPGTLARFEAARTRHPDSPYVYMIGAELRLAAGDTAGAIELHHTAAELKSDLPHNWYGLGRAYRAAGRQVEALDAFQRAADSGARGLYYLELAHQLFHGRDFDAAAKAFRQTYERSPRRFEGLIGELRCLLLAGRYEEAVLAGDSLSSILAQPSRKMVRLAPAVALSVNIDTFEQASKMKLKTLRRYVDQLRAWARDLDAGRPVDRDLGPHADNASLTALLALDLSLLP